jgi:NifU-like protein involved in Fe-S cluster formation
MIRLYDDVVIKRKHNPNRSRKFDYDKIIELKSKGLSGETIKRRLRLDCYHGYINEVFRNYKKALEAQGDS